MLACTLKQDIDVELFKSQLLEFIEDRDEPFTVRFLVESCHQPVSEFFVHDVLAQLEEEGLVIWIGEGRWISTKAVVKRALKPNGEVILPKTLISQIISTAIKRPELGYNDIAEFIRDAVKSFIKQHSKSICMESYNGGTSVKNEKIPKENKKIEE